MELYVVCQNCGEKTSTNFSYCRKCGAKLSLMKKIPPSSQKTSLLTSTQEKNDKDQLPTSESTEINYIGEERETITELEHLRNSPLAGRILNLLHQLEKLPSLSDETLEILKEFEDHSDGVVISTTIRILEKYTQEKADIEFIEEETLSSSVSNSLVTHEPIKTLLELQEVGQRLAASDKEIKKWHEWFLRQTDLYKKSQIEKSSYYNMFTSYQKFMQGRDLEIIICWEDIADLGETQ